MKRSEGKWRKTRRREVEQTDRGPGQGQGRDRDCFIGVCGGNGAAYPGETAAAAATTMMGTMSMTGTLGTMSRTETMEGGISCCNVNVRSADSGMSREGKGLIPIPADSDNSPSSSLPSSLSTCVPAS